VIVAFDIDGVIRDVAGSYRLALSDTVEHFTSGGLIGGGWRPTPIDIDTLKGEGIWNNDWEASLELVYRYFERLGKSRTDHPLSYETIVAFFQSRYRGEMIDGAWTGYLAGEPLLVDRDYFEELTAAGIKWGFFSGATTVSARFVLEGRVGLPSPLLVAMDDAPGKPDPAGLFMVMKALDAAPGEAVVYVGDTVADMATIVRAREQDDSRSFLAVGSLPPHVVSGDTAIRVAYEAGLRSAGADAIVASVREITSEFLLLSTTIRRS
jgi:HAD superfamily phosphatase